MWNQTADRRLSRNYGFWLYLLLFALILVGISFSTPNPTTIILFLLGLVLFQLLFIFSIGIRRLDRPISKTRLILPVATASAVMSVTTAMLTTVVSKFLVDNFKIYLLWDLTHKNLEYLFGVGFCVWFIFLFLIVKGKPQFSVHNRLSRTMFFVNLIFLIYILSYSLYTTKDFKVISWDMYAEIGLFCTLSGLIVLWTIGPALCVLFLRRKMQSRY